MCIAGSHDEIASHLDGGVRLAAERVNTHQAHAALCGAKAVPERVGEFDAFPGDRLRFDEFPRRERAVGLPAENLTEPPIVAY